MSTSQSDGGYSSAEFPLPTCGVDSRHQPSQEANPFLELGKGRSDGRCLRVMVRVASYLLDPKLALV